MKKVNKSLLFLGLTFVINYSMVGIFHLSGGNYSGVSGTVLATAYMFVPFIAALVVSRGIHKENIKKTFLISFKINKWFFIGWLLFPLLSFLTLGISLLFPGIEYSPEMSGMLDRFEGIMTPEQLEEMQASIDNMPFHPIWMALLQGLVAGATVNAVFGFGEEAAWRGYLLHLWKHLNFWKTSVYIGFIWGIWHAPLILMGHNYPQHPQIGVLMMIAWCILLTPVFIYLTLKAKSVIAAAVMHGTLNASVGIAIMVIEGGNDLTTGMTGLPGFIALGIAVLILIIYDRLIAKENLTRKNIQDYL